ncbi:hypothetical protein [Flavobacterium humi]|uniref:TonB-dependent receptor plug domain-containing protein n=1 Tax=Flavobacterium humi TaxID=2562683 RepID=A0A4Z0LBA6_9FLAO|nr:hypothetical protein [Flavobacterium humi]TGD59108.1 hypothetical protein E4635_04455 [Flavobacterium humi]
MDNQDTVFDQMKKAAEKAESKGFPSMDKVWNRVEEKLETKALAKKSNTWQKIAVAASVVALVSIGYQFFKPESTLVLPENKIVVRENTEQTPPLPIAEEVKIAGDSIRERRERETLLEKQLSNSGQTIVLQQPIRTDEIVIKNYFYSVAEEKKAVLDTISTKSDGFFNTADYTLKGRVFDAIGVHHIAESSTTDDNAAPKNPPLLVIDGKAVTANGKTKERMLAEMDGEETETIYLAEPLYIINGTYYSEEELFGKNPTSPYAPLDQQEIKTVKILHEKNEIAPYGKKGEKGVVIIITKDGKPSIKKGN